MLNSNKIYHAYNRISIKFNPYYFSLIRNGQMGNVVVFKKGVHVVGKWCEINDMYYWFYEEVLPYV